MQRPFIILAVGVTAAALLLAAAAAFWYVRPAKLTVAISAADADDYALMGAASQLLKFGRNTVRLQIHEVAGAAAASAEVDQGKADLAVIRTDVATPNNAQTVVILHRDAALLVAPAAGGVHEMGDLVGRTVGIVHRGPGNEQLLATALAQYDIAGDAVKLVALTPGAVAEAVASKAVDAVLAVDVISSPHLRDIVKAVGTDGGPPVFLPIAEADAIAQRSPSYEKLEVVRGAFGGTPPRPTEEYDTLAVTHRLVANENVDQNLISDLTRFFLTEKLQLATTVPIGRQIEAPSTDKGAPMPVHAGTAAYIDDDEQTFFDKYSDMIYIGAMLVGVLASGATAVLGRMNGRRAASLEGALSRLVNLLSLARTAPSGAALDELQQEADALLASALDTASAGSGEDRRLSAFGLALEEVRAAVRDRRVQLAGHQSQALNSPPLPVRTAAE